MRYQAWYDNKYHTGGFMHEKIMHFRAWDWIFCPKNVHGWEFHAWNSALPNFPWKFFGRKNHLRKLLEAKLSICYARLRKRIPPLLLKLLTPALLSHNSLRVTFAARSYKAWSKWFQISPSPHEKMHAWKKIVAWLFHAWKFYFHAWKWNLHAWNESFSQKFSWIRFPCIKWCTAQLPI